MKKIAVACLAAALAGAGVLAAVTPSDAVADLAPAGAFPMAADGTLTLAPMLDQVTPAVVNIVVRGTVVTRVHPFMNDPFFREFFGSMPPGIGQPRARSVVSAGSGVIVDAKRGLILTNTHVVQNAEEITVTLKDRRVLKGELVGSDPGTEIAVIRLKADNLTEVRLGNSDKTRVGDLVVAIGNPFGIGQTVTAGLISAKGREGLIRDGYEDFLQTDASINPGNSGGALVNSKGELVGINTAILAPGGQGGNIGIGFAVPVNIAKSVMDQIVETGTVKHGRIGVVIQSVDPSIAESLGLDRAEGVILVEPTRGGAAEKAGLRAGDVILTVNGEAIHSASVLRREVGLRRAGETVELGILRDGKRLSVTCRVEEGG
ncbi:trypsin-like peptidase domain-containing protein [Phaeovibrio sulfidiphilus]|uniref:Trypsin-like peptidase domain-containing protein n=1 Tax=Phaeovibrio sulfidiphilus TaxID=1220600 RepID=A0A8J6YNH1_9PROT|nr:trypsin-like peptidase domain-containing protein [Phaeovibrio sulfidiphilus]MBE1236157.1 trypsin-like peptidase domain-containing protein [Phaeovibrio sulfidiphilus]